MPDRLNEAVREFTRTVLNPFDLDALLQQVTEKASSTLRARGTGIMLEGDDGELGFAAASNDLVREVELAQDRTGTGPCVEAFTTNEIVVVEDLCTDTRWDDYGERATQLGLRSVVGVPLNAWGQTIGVLNVYRGEPAAWSQMDLEACELLAAMAAGYILNASQMQAQHELSEHLQAALESRGVIERAKGIIMGREGVDAATAFESLRQASMKRNEKLRDVARQIVAHAGDDIAAHPDGPADPPARDHSNHRPSHSRGR